MSGGILTGSAISEAVIEGHITISDFNPERLNPASYDLTLGSRFAVYREVTYFINREQHVIAKPATDEEAQKVMQDGRGLYAAHVEPLDVRKQNLVWQLEMSHERGLLLRPGIGYLMHTAERVQTKRFVPIIDGKSSLGRLFITAHITAGYGDPGFDGQYTLEVVVTHPVIVYPGMRFCQMRFHTLVGEVCDYSAAGHYVGAAAEGPVPSMSFKQFENYSDG